MGVAAPSLPDVPRFESPPERPGPRRDGAERLRELHLIAWLAQPLSVRLVSRCAWRLIRTFRLAEVGLSWIASKYPLLRSLIATHLHGYVSRDTAQDRIAVCLNCPFRYQHDDEAWYCRGDNNGRGCGCGHWKGSRLGYKVKLAAFRCPQKRFGPAKPWPFRNRSMSNGN